MAGKGKAKKKSSTHRPSAAGKERKYTRDNRGRFAATGATARGVRLATATGKRRTSRALAGHAKTIEAAKLKNTISKPRNLKPRAIKATPKPAPQLKATPSTKLRTRQNPGAKKPDFYRQTFPGTISKNKRLRIADNRQSHFNRMFIRAYQLNKGRGAEPLTGKKAKTERTRGKALDFLAGRLRFDGTETTVGRFPKVRTSTGFTAPRSSIKGRRAFAPGPPKPSFKLPILAPRPEKGNPLAKRAPVGSFRPGQLMSANAFPANAIAKKTKIVKHGYKDVKPDMTIEQIKQTIKNNLKIATGTANKQAPWLPVTLKGNRNDPSIAFVALNTATGQRRMQINSSHPRWQQPIKYGIQGRRTGEFASANPAHIMNHEIGHAKHRLMGEQQNFGNGETRIARRVSQYATTSVNEFVAEVRGARKTGNRYDRQIMGLYRKFSGLSPKPAPRFRPTAKPAAAAKPAKKQSRFTPSELAERKERADQLKAIPKPTRRAERIGRVARRQDARTGEVGSGIIRKGKSSSSDLVEDLAEGALLLKGDKTGRIGRHMQGIANKLRGRMAITAAGPRLSTNKKPSKNRIKAPRTKGVLAQRVKAKGDSHASK